MAKLRPFGKAVVLGVAAAAAANGLATASAQDTLLRGVQGVDANDWALVLESQALIAVLVDGADAYSSEELSRLYANRLGRSVDMADIVRLADEITALYRSNGYFLSRAVAAGDVVDGVARVTVYEGYITDVRATGDVSEQSRRIVDLVTQERPARISTVERALALLRETPGLRIRSATLEPDPHEPRAHTLNLELEQDNFAGRMRIDNRGDERYGQWRLSNEFSAYSILNAGDELELRVLAAPGDVEELHSFRLSYDTPINTTGARLSLEIADGRSNDESDETRTVQGGSVRLRNPLILQQHRELWAFAETAYLAVEDGELGSHRVDEELLSVAVGLYGRHGQTSYYSQLLLGRAASPTDELRSRFDADDEYARLSLILRHRASLPANLRLTVRSGLQIASGPLPRSEEMTVGGATYGRAYSRNVLRGDHGLAASAEMQVRGLNLASIRVEPYFFFDGAVIYNGHLGEAVQDEIASAGGGVRLEVANDLVLELEAARALLNAADPWRQSLNLVWGF